jgi:hypothetical protein
MPPAQNCDVPLNEMEKNADECVSEHLQGLEGMHGKELHTRDADMLAAMGMVDVESENVEESSEGKEELNAEVAAPIAELRAENQKISGCVNKRKVKEETWGQTMG